jgi:hypothetical protein
MGRKSVIFKRNGRSRSAGTAGHVQTESAVNDVRNTQFERMASGADEEAMKRSRFSEEDMVKILREADTAPVSEVAKKHAISDQTIYLWRKRFGQLEAVDVKRLRQLEAENLKLKKLVAERDLEIDVIKEISRKKW